MHSWVVKKDISLNTRIILSVARCSSNRRHAEPETYGFTSPCTPPGSQWRKGAKPPTELPFLFFLLLHFCFSSTHSGICVHDTCSSRLAAVRRQLREATCQGQGLSVGPGPTAFALTIAPFRPCSPAVCGHGLKGTGLAVGTSVLQSADAEG